MFAGLRSADGAGKRDGMGPPGRAPIGLLS